MVVRPVISGSMEKPLHGDFPHRTQDSDVDRNNTYQWLSSFGLKGEMEGFIFAAKDQCLPMRNYQSQVLRNGTNSRGRFSDSSPETKNHIISGSNREGQYIHWVM